MRDIRQVVKSHAMKQTASLDLFPVTAKLPMPRWICLSTKPFPQKNILPYIGLVFHFHNGRLAGRAKASRLHPLCALE
jgi:hypothetical protein